MAGIGLAVVCGSMLAGCSVSDEQQVALDVLTSNTENLVNLVDDYLTSQNKQLSKQEAFEMLTISRNIIHLGLVEQMEIKLIVVRMIGILIEKLMKVLLINKLNIDLKMV